VDVDEPLPPPSSMDKEQMLKVLERRKELKTWLDDVYAYYFREAYVNGQSVPGFKLVEGRAKSRAWSKEFLEPHIVSELVRNELMEDECFTRKLVTPAQAKKLLGKDKFEKLDGILTPLEKSVELVPESDHRKCVGGADFFPDESDPEN